MTIIELKSNLHSLIENINDKNILSGFYQLLIKTKKIKLDCYGTSYHLNNKMI